ncbi:MAG: bifunctional diaminohydroxyphosphoribosylaminopyrimidine deaminase/5-amino-6-(5-phosphoribosylamino)uracil reductase RibD [Candidatus Omnitrophica bacterium]|nr:bifunctional diaminohydroxyphosphoribosylaminopyrimidine deaminase/5-amino-6-(5-phosphoribosylamino)uracil reductase RibD [Candidatus Omnitrophota bacterium]MCG2704476.1 bifunctional diaminohydroxyphosphoribosylaminopyrimidine deaminase/5-amino-6-(5-phosphoribosylamino)uracil reductase RibD [Candidatus Omnitrophota bacterium]
MKIFHPRDRKYMAIALSLAEKGIGMTAPNPVVGAVLVKNGRIVAADYHRKAGAPHAEALAIKRAGKDARGATLYCTLEACAHYGKTPPCADLVIKSGIKRAVFAMKDPNPLNNGKGLTCLKKAGIKTECGILEDEARSLNRPFIKFMKKRLPYVTLKIAQSLDGKIADKDGCSKWISSEESRHLVHKLRALNDAVMVGVNTLMKDDPLLNNRHCPAFKKQPLRIILDTDLRTPKASRILKNSKGDGAILIACGKGVSLKKKRSLEKKGAEVVLLPRENGRVKLISLLRYLYARGIMSLLCEGGSELCASLVKNRLADEAYFFISPKIIGGKSAPTACGGSGSSIKDATGLKDVRVETCGPDIVIRGEF